MATPAQATATTQTRGEPALVKAPARAFRYQRMLDAGHYASLSEMAEAEKLDRGYMGRLLQLTLLAPDLVAALLNGSDSVQLDLPRLLDSLPAEWTQQRTLLG